MVRKVISYTLLGITLLGIASHWMVTHTNLNPTLKRGLPIDSFNGVYVYYNGGTSQSSGRNVIDGYNVGIRYQCVEFVKRYYYLHYHHHMPDTYGNAKDFFDKKLSSGSLNTARGLFQYKNRDQVRPQKGDLLYLILIYSIPMDMLLSFLTLPIRTLRLFNKIRVLGGGVELI